MKPRAPSQPEAPIVTTMVMVGRAALRALGLARERVLEQVRDVNRLTEHGTLAAGQQLQTVVEVARGTIAQLGRMLSSGGTSDNELVRAIHGLSKSVRTHTDAMTTAVHHNTAQVGQIAGELKTITRAAREVELLNAAARVLSINARIEANRQSSSGNAFKAIAAEMQELSRAISSANTQITELAESIDRTLPALIADSQGLADQVGQFAATARSQIAEVDRHVSELQANVYDTLADSDKALAQIVTASHAGLSELQFQDVCAQKLLLIDRSLGESHREVAATLGLPEEAVEQDVKPAAYQTLGEDTALSTATGEVLLF